MRQHLLLSSCHWCGRDTFFSDLQWIKSIQSIQSIQSIRKVSTVAVPTGSTYVSKMWQMLVPMICQMLRKWIVTPIKHKWWSRLSGQGLASAVSSLWREEDHVAPDPARKGNNVLRKETKPDTEEQYVSDHCTIRAYQSYKKERMSSKYFTFNL